MTGSFGIWLTNRWYLSRDRIIALLHGNVKYRAAFPFPQTVL